MGRPAKPQELHELNGTRSKAQDTANALEFTPSAGRPKYPRGIAGEAKAAFKRHVKMLEERRALTPGDQEVLRLLAVLIDRHIRALDAIAKQGEVCRYTRLNSNGEDVQVEKPNLWLKIAETCESKILMCLTQLGLTPSARTKVKPTREPKQTAPPPDETAFFSRDAVQPPVEDEPDLDAINTAVM